MLLANIRMDKKVAKRSTAVTISLLFATCPFSFASRLRLAVAGSVRSSAKSCRLIIKLNSNKFITL